MAKLRHVATENRTETGLTFFYHIAGKPCRDLARKLDFTPRELAPFQFIETNSAQFQQRFYRSLLAP